MLHAAILTVTKSAPNASPPYCSRGEPGVSVHHPSSAARTIRESIGPTQIGYCNRRRKRAFADTLLVLLPIVHTGSGEAIHGTTAPASKRQRGCAIHDGYSPLPQRHHDRSLNPSGSSSRRPRGLRATRSRPWRLVARLPTNLTDIGQRVCPSPCPPLVLSQPAMKRVCHARRPSLLGRAYDHGYRPSTRRGGSQRHWARSPHVIKGAPARLRLSGKGLPSDGP
jgi:hypothetical protein